MNQELLLVKSVVHAWFPPANITRAVCFIIESTWNWLLHTWRTSFPWIWNICDVVKLWRIEFCGYESFAPKNACVMWKHCAHVLLVLMELVSYIMCAWWFRNSLRSIIGNGYIPLLTTHPPTLYPSMLSWMENLWKPCCSCLRAIVLANATKCIETLISEAQPNDQLPNGSCVNMKQHSSCSFFVVYEVATVIWGSKGFGIRASEV